MGSDRSGPAADAGAAPPRERGGRDDATLDVVPPAVDRDDVRSDGRVGAVAYPYRVYEASVAIGRPLLPDREVSYVASVDRSRRLVVRADEVPDVETRSVEDVLVLPRELSADDCRERARDTVLSWTMRRFALGSAPEITFPRRVDAYRLYWLASRPDGDVVVDSVRGDETPLVD